jgi:archaellum component FlaC
MTDEQDIGSFDEDDGQTTFADVTDDVDRIDTNVNGLFAKVAEMQERIDELEEEVETLRRRTDTDVIDEATPTSAPSR